MDRVNGWQETGELVLPKGYHVGNAIKMAWLYLQTVENMSKQKAIDVCTKDSICNALLQMVIHGEYPQKHCYFIMYGDRLEWNERYLGKLMRAKRDTEIEKVNAQVIYEGDEFVYTIDDDGQKQLVKHVPNLANIDNTKILAAYAVVINKDGSRHIEVMTRAMIQSAWEQGAMKGKSGAHTKFTDQMCEKTVKNRLTKHIIRTYGEPDTITEYEKDEEFEGVDVVAEDVAHDIQQNANSEDFIVDAEVSETVENPQSAESEVVQGEVVEKAPFEE